MGSTTAREGPGKRGERSRRRGDVGMLGRGERLQVGLDRAWPAPAAKKDVQGLYQAVREPLGLTPDKTGLSDDIANDVRTILGGLNSVVNGIGALRTHGGDAHGRERGYRRIDPCIARLAIHSASTVSLFLVETWQKKQPARHSNRAERQETIGGPHHLSALLSQLLVACAFEHAMTF
ncbi:abortive infection family protein [Bradyrhizobium genosp. P]|uniref:abortive infection family protein n=1 Tax=Bradyrhizobium genosp. P TaxID=83641 RepID=UPI003CEA54E3